MVENKLIIVPNKKTGEHQYILNGVDLTETFLVTSLDLKAAPGGVELYIRLGAIVVDAEIENPKVEWKLAQ